MTASSALIGFVAAQHAAFFALETLLFETPLGRRVFGLTAAEQAGAAAVFAKNQGVYNLFLAAGLGWALTADPALAPQLKTFFLGCVAVAGAAGGLTARGTIFLLQGVPALLALALLRAGL
ncbi:MAG: DUF1304 domain-containing protein [Elusimicrobiota bacterium]|nr:MAG: DUF1304 domain-containing protein [Elusimicrobiota bacterium]